MKQNRPNTAKPDQSMKRLLGYVQSPYIVEIAFPFQTEAL